MKVIIAGGRNITDYELVWHAIDAAGFEITEVVSGAARGVDELGEQYALEYDLPVRRFPADWNAHGKMAGPLRNGAMAQYADALILIWDGASRGSASMLRCAQREKLKVYECRIPA